MPIESFPTLDMWRARRELPQIYDLVVRRRGRVEITRLGSRERCVVISKAELDGLEKAIEILSDRDEFRALSGRLARLAAES